MTARPSTVAALLALGLFLGPAPAARGMTLAECLAPTGDCTLREAAALAGVRIGSAIGPHLFESDPDYAPTLAREFDSVTAENAHKWKQLHPAQGVYDFTDADAVVDFAEANGMRVRGHTLLWSNPIRIPDYVNALDTPEAVRAELEEHIATVAGRYAGRIESWDVVNEPLVNTGDTFFDNVFRQQLGPGYIAEAFELAHAAAPEAKLFLNEVFNTVPGTDRFTAFYDLVADLVNQGVPIHGVGLQTHLLGNLSPVDVVAFQAAVQAYADLGLRVEITEMDVPMFSGTDRLADQAEIVFDVVSACLAVLACDGVTFWGFTDRYSWIDGTFGPGFQPLLLDEDYVRKPSYFALRDALLARAAAVPEPGPATLFGFTLLGFGYRARSETASRGLHRPGSPCRRLRERAILRGLRG